MSKEGEIHVPVIGLINTVFEKTPKDFQANLADVILENNELRIVVYKYVLLKDQKISSNLSNETFRLQNMLLHNELVSYHTKVDMDLNVIVYILLKKFEEFKKLIHLYDAKENIRLVLKKIGFKTALTVEKELVSLQNNLIVDCLTYYVTKNAGAAYYPDIGPPIFQLIKIATLELSKNIKNFSNIGFDEIKYFPILFEKPKAFQEVICKLIKHHKTALKEYESCDNDEIELEKLDKNTLCNIMSEESVKWRERLKNLPPIVRLRDFYAPQVEELIKKQAFNRMSEGLPADVISAQKSKKTTTKEDSTKFKLNSTFNAFEYNCESNQPIIVTISEINKVLFGEKASAKIDEKLLKKTPIMSLVLFETNTNEKHAFSIDPEYHQLINDVISLSENKKIDEKWEPQFYTPLLDCIIEVNLMDLSERDIPTEPPPIPEPPPNFDFSCPE
ncbi:hypothetical protein HZS_3469 [Henneguya salminicola]|nr:hypothetical protein HZS_3469 [Henneguya salminicola]